MFSEKEALIKMIFIFVKSIIILSHYLHFDKRNNIKRKTIEYLAIFIFCDLYVVIDVIKELKAKSHTTQKALIVVLMVLLIANSAAGSVNIIYNNLDCQYLFFLNKLFIFILSNAHIIRGTDIIYRIVFIDIYNCLSNQFFFYVFLHY